MISPLVSVIIPTYNGGNLLKKTIESACLQQYENIEIIIVDDGSTHDVWSAVEPFSERVFFVRQENAGPGAARIRGVQESHGELISFLDHDDLWAPEKVQKQVACFQKNPQCGLVYSYPILINEVGDIIENEPPSFFPEGNVLKDFLARNRITTFSATMIKRSAYDKVGGIDPDRSLITCDDYDLWLRLAAEFQVMFAHGDLVFYRIHPNNFVKNYELNMNAHIAVINKFQKKILPTMQLDNKEIKLLCRENIFNTYCKFAFLFYYKQNKIDNKKARDIFFKALSLHPLSTKCIFYYIMTLGPIFYLRKLIRCLRKNDV